ncbi:HlyD family efflux transporter periplasmic adaptor subunit [Oscillochloris sp. ZM17-4]|uniref:HlyD family efflux transporter periplasmic adaptor subunit n=1 Tax=Oscillochloris sp. ZM17-4 TaxID=2866714 RepID=UPI001C730736|nr:biotin/lipoyl-binding protein [Oscillochloris sp. ZM17-4]MBX0328011.1 HlyD family efflux transporter periplasmic adaptor subunit [Oscillochloris sp. ZM17-4]
MSVTSTAPERKAPSRRLGKRKGRLSPWLLLPVALVLIVVGLLLWQLRQSTATATTTSTATVTQGALALSVTGSGPAQAIQSRSLSFSVAGTVQEVLVTIGDTVTAGQPLARIDDTTLRLAVQQAEANLKSAEAKMAAAQGKGATAQDIASAQASLASAQAGYEKTRTGNATAGDIASARANLASAQAKLAELKAGPTADTLSTARTRVQQAQITLSSQRESLSAAKTKAEGALTSAANSLRDAQDAYSTIYWSNRQAESRPGDLPQSSKDQEASALRAVQNAEASLAQAQASFAQAKQDEVNGVANAESSLKDAQVQLDALLAGPTATDLTSAQASVASAQSSLDKLLNPATASDLISAQASVDQAKINLEKLTSPSSDADMASAEAGLAQAQVQLETAKLDLTNAVLTAPFDGVVSAVGISTGDSATAGTIDMIDASKMYIDISLGESDVSQVKPGMDVALTFDAVPDVAINGVIDTVAPVATVTQNVVTYPVRVSFDPGSAPIRVGMTASGTIVTKQISDAILVPSRAIQTRGSTSLVQVQQAPGQPSVPVRVETGLSANGQTEILSCVDTGSQCLRAGDTLVISAATTTTGGTTQQRGTGGFGGGVPRGVPFP